MQKLHKASLLVLTLASAAANAIPEIPAETGWSGHIGLGASAGSSESNMLSSISSVDLGDERVRGLDQSPDDEDIALPMLPFEAARMAILGSPRTNRPDQQRALRRTGEVYRVELNYDWKPNDRHSLVPGIGYIDEDLDGSAMAQDGLLLQLEHVYDRNRWSVVSTLYLQDMESDSSNPVYDDSNDVETLGGSVTAYYRKPFGLENWSANTSVLYYEGDSNNDFYDSSLSLFSLGMLYRF